MRLFKNWYLVKSPKLKPQKGDTEYPIKVLSKNHLKRRGVKSWFIDGDDLFKKGFGEGYVEALKDLKMKLR